MVAHPENGAFTELDCGESGEGRLPSGAIYYYVAPGEHTGFHRIDCGEYWCWHAGAPLEVWMIDRDGHICIRRLGTEDGCDPIVYFPAGVIFAARAEAQAQDGTFISCITVPHFTYDGFELFEDKDILGKYPDVAPFFNEQK